MNFQTVEELMATPGLDLDPTKTTKFDWPDPDIETEEDDDDAGDLPDDEFDRDDDERYYSNADLHRLFDENHGLTAEGYALLAKMDDMGDFV